MKGTENDRKKDEEARRKTAATDEGWFPEGLTWEWILTSRIFPIRRVPKPVRLLWADVLTKVLKGINEKPKDVWRWKLLLALPKLCLRLPKRGGRKKRQVFDAAPFIRKQLEEAKAGNWRSLWEQARGGKESREEPKRRVPKC